MTRWLLSLSFLLLLGCGRPPAETQPTDPLVLGQRIYLTNCASCHGHDGRGLLRNKRFAADFTEVGGVLTRSDEDLAHSIREGVKGRNGIMPAFKPIFGEEQVAAVLSYVRKTYGHGAATGVESPASE